MAKRLRHGIRKLKNIYVPRPRDSEDEDDDHDVEEEQPVTPSWHRYFEPNELLGRYEPIRELDRGAYSVRFSGKELKKCNKSKPDSQVMITKLRRVLHTEQDARRVLRELRTLRMLRNHDRIVSLQDIVPPSDPKLFSSLTIIFEMMDANLDRIFHTNQFFTTLHVQHMLYQILLGVKHMHSFHLAHCDLKPSKILINEDCTVKICDFKSVMQFHPNDQQLVASGKQTESTDKEPEGQSSSTDKKKKRRKLKRPMNCHAITHWYKAPEVLLSETKVCALPATDVWGIGTIFGELLQMQREHCPDPTKRGPLFPGDCNIPIQQYDPDEWGRRSQMDVIFDLIGSPDESEMAAIVNEKARKYIRNLPLRKKKKLRRFFPGSKSDQPVLDLFSKFLMFDVHKRITIDEALQHPFLETIRLRGTFTNSSVASPVAIVLESRMCCMEGYRGCLLHEVLQYNPEEKSRFQSSGVLAKEQVSIPSKSFMFTDAYFRRHIRLLFNRRTISVPAELVYLCCAYWSTAPYVLSCAVCGL